MLGDDLTPAHTPISPLAASPRPRRRRVADGLRAADARAARCGADRPEGEAQRGPRRHGVSGRRPRAAADQGAARLRRHW